MRVLMLSWEYPPHVVGGLGKHVREIVPALASAGVEIVMITPRWAGGAPTEGNDKVRIVRVDPPGDVNGYDFFENVHRTNWLLESRAREVLDSLGGFDLIHAHDWLVAFAAIKLKHDYRLPLLATIHATEYGRGRGHLNGHIPWAIHGTEWQLTYEAWRVITCSGYMANEVATLFQCPRDKIDVIPNGITLPDHPPLLAGPERLAFRRRFAADDERLVLHIGRIVQEKGLGVLVEAMPRVLSVLPSAKFVIVGTGGYLNAARQRGHELVGAKVYFTGFIPDADRDYLYQVADVAVFPSLYEPFGIVALEAMAARCPVVVSDAGGLPEVVQHNETGIVTYANNPDSLAWGILHTLQHPDWTAARVENACRRVREAFNWQRIAYQTVAVYQRISDERTLLKW